MPKDANATTKETVAVLIAVRGDFSQDYPLEEVNMIGRSPENAIAVGDPIASRRHAEVRRLADGRYEISDCGSMHGTFVNSTAITRHTLQEGDEIIIGATLLRFCYKEAGDVQRRRQHTRVACQLPVRVVADGVQDDAKLIDLSIGGARIEWRHPVEAGAHVVLKIAFPGRWLRLKIEARTIHWSEQRGLGVSFIYNSGRQQEALAREFARLFVSTKDIVPRSP